MEQILHIINEMSPYLLLGFFLAGLMHTFVPSKLYSRYLSAPSFRSVINAALLGIPLPLCSCGVIPTAMSLHKEGASKGATVSFLIATPQTGVDSIVATYSLMGLPFAITRIVAALFTALFGGQLTNLSGDGRKKEKQCCCHDEKHEGHSCCDDDDCGCHDNHCSCHKESHAKRFGEKLKEAFHYAFVDMMGDIGKWLVIGLVVAGLITVLVPDSFFAIFAGNSLLSMLLVLLMAIPMYLCATGSIPIAVALMMKGLTPGAALVLLMAGPAANIASILVIRKSLGSRTAFVYLLSIILGAITFGLGIDYMMPREWFVSSLVADSGECLHESASWFEWGCSILLGLLLLYALVIRRHDECGCGCGCNEEHEEKHCCCGEKHEEDKHCCCGEKHEEEKHCCCGEKDKM